MPESPSERSLRAKLAACERWSREDPRPQAQRMRDAFDKRFLDQVDPTRCLPEAERLRRAASARSAYFARLALKSAQARRKSA